MLDLTKLYREAKLPRFMHDHADGREALARLVGVVLEEAAKVCDGLDAMSRDPMVARGSADECAEAIRAMKPTS